MRQPRLVMTLLVRDEADIVAQNVAWHLARGVDHVIATDNGSTDGTAEALEPFVRAGRLTRLFEPSTDYLQDVWTTRMALMARDDFGADWVICNDADEFWRAPSGDLRDVLPGGAAPAMLVCARHNMIAAREDLDGGDWAGTLVHRAVDPPPPPDAPPTEAGLTETPLDRPFFQYRLPPKVILPTRGLAAVTRGAHGARYDAAAPPRRPCPVEIFHYPVRDRAEFARSIENIGAAVRRVADLPIGTSWKYRRWWKMTQAAGSTLLAFREALPDRRRLAHDLAAGRVVEDRSMARALGRLPPRPGTPPEVPRTGEMGTLLLVVGPDAARNAALAGRLVDLGATPPLDGAGALDAVSAAILTEAGRGGADPRPLPPGWAGRGGAAALRGALLEALLTDFADLDRAVLHDERLCLLLPFWRDIARAQGLGLEVILATGDPEPGGRAEAALLRAARILAAERASRGLSRRVVPHDAAPAETRGLLEGALSSGEREGPPRGGRPQSPAPLAGLVGEAFEAMADLSRRGETPEIHARLDAIAARLEAASEIFGAPLADAAAEAGRLARARDRGLRRVVRAEASRDAAELRAARLAALLRCRARLLDRRRGRIGRDRRHLAAIRGAAEFDPDWYLATYPDVATGGLDPALHFLRHGAREGRNPGPGFDTLRYYDANPDVLQAGQIALLHYLRHGRDEGRAAFPALPWPV